MNDQLILLVFLALAVLLALCFLIYQLIVFLAFRISYSVMKGKMAALEDIKHKENMKNFDDFIL